MNKEDYLKEYRNNISRTAGEIFPYSSRIFDLEENDKGTIFDYKRNCTDLIEEEEVLSLIGLLLMSGQKIGIQKKRLIEACTSRIEDDIRQELEWSIKEEKEYNA